MNGALRKLGLSLRALTLDFENRDLGLLGVARILTSFATWSFAIALGVYGFEAHGAIGVGLVALIRYLPGALASPFAGLMIDRYPRRRVLLVSSLAMTAVLVGAAIAASLEAPAAVVFVFPALFAIAACAYGPAESALVPGLAKTPQELSAGNVTHAAMENGGFLLAAIGTGFMLAASSPGFVFAVAMFVSAAAVATVAAIAPDRRPEYDDDEEEEDASGVLREAALGLRALVEHPALRLASLTLIVLLLFEGFADVLTIVMALELLHLEESSVGFLNATWGFGALVGGAGLALLLDRGKLVVAIAGGSLVRVRDDRIVDVGPRSAHIAGLAYAAFQPPESIVDPVVEFMQPRPGDPEDYVAVRLGNGHRIAITNTDAANVLGVVKPGDYAYGHPEAARRAMAPLAARLGLDVEATARRILDVAVAKITPNVSSFDPTGWIASAARKSIRFPSHLFTCGW